MLKRIFATLISFIVFSNLCLNAFAQETIQESATEQSTEASTDTPTENSLLQVSAKSAILMEATTGKVLFEYNADEQLPPASVTKIMTLLLIYEAVENGKIKWDDIVTVSEHASSMGGSQIFLEPMEQQTVKDLTKSIAIASANDAAVAMAEYLGGSEENFVKMMNERAKEIGMENTNFENACGLDADTINHYMSSRDIAIVSRVLMTNYPEIQEFTTKWQDTITHSTQKGNTEFGLTNTNKLLKMYDGATGLKTGSTGKALYCLSGTAERNGLSLIAVVMGAPDPKVRFQEVVKMFDYGFANYEVVECDPAGKVMGTVAIYKGKEDSVNAIIKQPFNVVREKGNAQEVTTEVEMIEAIKAPFDEGSKLGEVVYKQNGQEVGRIDIVAENGVEKAGIADVFKKLLIDWVN